MAMKADAYWFPGWGREQIYQQEEMLIKSQVTRMRVLNICVSNGFIYLLYMTRFVCTLHNISSWFNLKLALQKLKWHVSREINCTTIKETLRVHLTVRTPSLITARNSRNTLQLKILPEKITKETVMGKHVKGIMYFQIVQRQNARLSQLQIKMSSLKDFIFTGLCRNIVVENIPHALNVFFSN